MAVGAEFGTCCSDLRDALTLEAERLFFVDEGGVLRLSVGFVMTADGPGWFDMAALYCPFCGTPLQDRNAVAASVPQ